MRAHLGRFTVPADAEAPATGFRTAARNRLPPLSLAYVGCSKILLFRAKELERLEQGHVALQLDFEVLKRFGFLRPVLPCSLPERRLRAASVPPWAPPRPPPALPSSVNSFVPSSLALSSVSEGPWCSCEVSMTNSGKARRAFLMSTKPLCHKIVASGAKIPPWH